MSSIMNWGVTWSLQILGCEVLQWILGLCFLKLERHYARAEVITEKQTDSVSRRTQILIYEH